MNLNGLKPAPSMSTSGWVVDSEGKYDRLLSYYFTTDSNQGAIGSMNTSSFSSIIRKYNHAPNSLVNQLEQELNTYFTNYYSKAQVKVSLVGTYDELSNKYGLIVEVSAYDLIKGNPDIIQYARLLNIENSTVQSIVKYNNEGQYDYYAN